MPLSIQIPHPLDIFQEHSEEKKPNSDRNLKSADKSNKSRDKWEMISSREQAIGS